MRSNDIIVLDGEVAKRNAMTLVVLVGGKGPVDITQDCLRRRGAATTVK